MLRHSSACLLLLIAATAHAQTPPASMPAMPGMPSMPAQPAAPGVAPAQQLPEVNVPSVAAPAAMAPAAVAPPVAAPTATVPAAAVPAASLPATQAAPVAPPVVAPPAADPIVVSGNASDFSYGDSDVSLLFTKRQMERMKNVLSVYETARRNRSDVPIEVVEEQADAGPVATVVAEPTVYPVFTLKSIAFRNASDWTVWIGNLRITPHKNDQEVRVLAVSPNRAQFLWKPAYSEAMRQRANLKLFADTSKVKHKKTAANTAIYDNAAGQVTFTLLQNQSFAPAYMSTFEGKVASPALTPLPKEGEQDDSGMLDGELTNEPTQPADTSAANPNNLDALLKQQQKGGAESMFQRSLNTAPAPNN